MFATAVGVAATEVGETTEVGGTETGEEESTGLANTVAARLRTAKVGMAALAKNILTREGWSVRWMSSCVKTGKVGPLEGKCSLVAASSSSWVSFYLHRLYETASRLLYIMEYDHGNKRASSFGLELRPFREGVVLSRSVDAPYLTWYVNDCDGVSDSAESPQTAEMRATHLRSIQDPYSLETQIRFCRTDADDGRRKKR